MYFEVFLQNNVVEQAKEVKKVVKYTKKQVSLIYLNPRLPSNMSNNQKNQI